MGRFLSTWFREHGHRVVVLTRGKDRAEQDGVRYVHWNGLDHGTWDHHLEGATALINLCGRSVDCRYTARNREAILQSRLVPTRILGEAIKACNAPPPVWINLSSATVYRHAEDRPMDEDTGELGADFSPQVVLAWEKAFFEQADPRVRQVAVRCAMVFSPLGGAFPRFTQLTRSGLGGHHAGGTQFVSWVHETDVARFFQWIIDTPAVNGIINLASPNPLREMELMRELRKHVRPMIAFNVPLWMLGIGAFFLRTETELVLKSRRVVPTRALRLGFSFQFPTITRALDALFAPGTQQPVP